MMTTWNFNRVFKLETSDWVALCLEYKKTSLFGGVTTEVIKYIIFNNEVDGLFNYRTDNHKVFNGGISGHYYIEYNNMIMLSKFFKNDFIKALDRVLDSGNMNHLQGQSHIPQAVIRENLVGLVYTFGQDASDGKYKSIKHIQAQRDVNDVVNVRLPHPQYIHYVTNILNKRENGSI